MSILGARASSWKTVHCHSATRVGHQTFEVLLQHAFTLEEVSIASVYHTLGVILILNSHPRLRKFVATDNFQGHPYADIPVTDFTQAVMQSWPCTAMLETLAVNITQIPIQDATLHS